MDDECRRCSECQGQDHHWLDNPDFGNDDDDPEDPTSIDFQFLCKHCPARGGECPECDGDGVISSPTFEGDDIEEDCPKCEGWGIIEGLAYTGWRDE